MNMNTNKSIFLIMLMLSTLITISANNWLGMWMGLEMNLMSFIPFISKFNNKKSSQAMMIYFLTQAMGSIILLFTVLINPLIFTLNLSTNSIMTIMIMISIMIKVGAAPFHLWLPEMMTNLNWMECSILMTWQKLAPLMIMNNINTSNWFLYLSVLLSTLAGSIGGLNQTSLRKIMAYSSINHLGWMMVFMGMQSSWYKYLIIYSMLVWMICWMMMKMNAFFMNQLILMSPNMIEKYTYATLMLSMGGLPPFLGFLPKWMVIQSMMNSYMYMLMFLMMMMSLITLFYYMRIMTPMLLSYSMINKWMKYNSLSKMMLFTFLTINLTLPVFMGMGFF
uniref:NADH-ubiquinone oxidoreductase chain 2 n=1 Tax=Physomerus sp. TaxID=2931302 RepID=A0A8T9ZXI0_9HEMI|nr:NADH dehydrogenase subunit 2 [Physomerus sp.]